MVLLLVIVAVVLLLVLLLILLLVLCIWRDRLLLARRCWRSLASHYM